MGAEEEIIAILREKDAGIISGQRAVREIMRSLQRQVRAEIAEAALGSWDAHHLPQVLAAIQAHITKGGGKLKEEAGWRLDGMADAGHLLVDHPLMAAEFSIAAPWLGSAVLRAMKDFAFHKMDDVSQAAFERIRSELTMGILGQKTPGEVSRGIGKNLSDPSIFRSIDLRAETITKTEMGRVFSQATELRMEQAAKSVKGLMKEWRHAGHPVEPRPSHLAADGQRVPVDEPFRIGGVLMMFPRDPAAPLEEVINCGCDHVPWHPAWEKE